MRPLRAISVPRYFVFLIGGIIEQAVEAGLSMSFLSVCRSCRRGHLVCRPCYLLLVVCAAMIFGAIQPGDVEGFHKYTFERINVRQRL